MSKFEYVNKKEYSPVREEIEELINQVQDLVKKKFTFRFEIAGSGKRHIITREVNGNKGFDFDYSLILNNPCEGKIWIEEFAKKTLMDAFRKVAKGTYYSDPEDSTSAITIKVKDKQHSRIIHSCDLAIVCNIDDGKENYQAILIHNNKTNSYILQRRSQAEEIDVKLECIRNKVKNYRDFLKDEYLNAKDSNQDPDKHSFQLYYEAVNNVYDHFIH